MCAAIVALPLISAQLTYYDAGYPPAPGRRNGATNGRLVVNGNGRNGAIQQAPIDDSQEQEPQEVPQDIAITQRPYRNGNGFSQQPIQQVPKSNGNGNGARLNGNTNGYYRYPQPSYGIGGGQVAVSEDEGKLYCINSYTLLTLLPLLNKQNQILNYNKTTKLTNK